MVSQEKLEIREVRVSEVRPLRTRVLRPWFEEGKLLVYDNDEGMAARHFAAVDAVEQRVVGVVSYVRESIPVQGVVAGIRLRGMAVAEDLQRQGVGSRLLSESLATLASDHPGSNVWAAARVAVVEFYGHHGFDPVGPRFEIPSVGPHQRMVCCLCAKNC